MFARLNQVARQLSRSYPAYTRTSAAGIRPGIANQPRIMAAQNNARMIHTAGCLIIGDEVLGGKVCTLLLPPNANISTISANIEVRPEIPTRISLPNTASIWGYNSSE